MPPGFDPGRVPRVAVIANSAWYLRNFRLNLMHRLAAQGHDVVGISPDDEHSQALRSQGLRHVGWQLDPASTHPLHELRSLLQLRGILQRESVDVALTYTPKANIYAGLAVRGLPTVFGPNVSGLGSGFLRHSPLSALMRGLYRLSFGRAHRVFFQNGDDRTLFLQGDLVAEDRCIQVPGSGVDLQHFRQTPLPCGRPRTLLYVGRLLADKGLRELAESMRLLRHRRAEMRLVLLGPAEARNPSALAPSVIRSWIEEGLLTHIDAVDDVRPYLEQADGVVLPSYREGVPRSLLEAAAMGRPCIAADVPGCRDVVVNDETGWLCPPRSAAGLAAALERFIDAEDAELRTKGAAARAHVERTFSEEIVLAAYTAFLRDALR